MNDAAAREFCVGQYAQGEVRDGAQSLKGLRVGKFQAFFFQQKPDFHSALPGCRQAFKHLVHDRACVVGDIELFDIDTLASPVKQLAPDLAGCSQVRRLQVRPDRHGVYQFETRDGEVCLRARTAQQ